MLNPADFPRQHGSYTVAIICALNLELSAVRYLLDREHPSLPKKQGDSNLYILGELSGHNVALAWLSGKQGKAEAATAATHLHRSFPSIEWLFVVGSAGGIPSEKHDIRLGDVVIGMPEGQYGGVVQYDLGKALEGGFQLKGFLLPPPTLLRNAVELMRSNHMVGGNKIDEFVLEMRQRGPQFSEYRRPPTECDLLFEPGYTHGIDISSCAACDKHKTLARRPREFAGPEIHYGLIASGDRVIKSATKRQAIVDNIGDILCFETETAGIATEYTCLTVRGISNYADSHKNDIWQHYAVAAAAATVKELLLSVPGGLQSAVAKGSYIGHSAAMEDRTGRNAANMKKLRM